MLNDVDSLSLSEVDKLVLNDVDSLSLKEVEVLALNNSDLLSLKLLEFEIEPELDIEILTDTDRDSESDTESEIEVDKLAEVLKLYISGSDLEMLSLKLIEVDVLSAKSWLKLFCKLL